MPKLNILLTGSSGFVGSHVAKVLQLHSLSAISTITTEIDSADKVYLWSQINEIEGPFDVIVHMAGMAHDTKNQKAETAYFDVNVGLTKVLLSNLTRWNCKQFIYLSSVKAVVDSTSEVVLNEDLAPNAKNVYGRSKLAAEQEIIRADDTVNYVILRPVMIYGQGQKGNLNTLEKLVKKGLYFPFKYWQNKRSVLSVNNLTNVISQLLSRPITSGVYSISDDSAVSTVDILKYIGEGIDRKPRFLAIPNRLIRIGLRILPQKIRGLTDKLLGSLEIDNSKLKKALGISNMPHNTATDMPLAFNKRSNTDHV